MRPQDWPARLDAYLAAAREKPFAWGSHDCVSFTCGWYAAMTGRHVYAGFAGRYDSEQSALRLMLANGVRSTAEAGDFLFGKSARKEIEYAQRGDIVLALDAVTYAEALGISTGAHAACLLDEGVRFARQSHFLTAWSV